ELVRRELAKLGLAGSTPVPRSVSRRANGAPGRQGTRSGAPSDGIRSRLDPARPFEGAGHPVSAPVVAIIGRPNVGKSTFFNRVLGARRAVVHDRPGITRDRNAAPTEWGGRAFMLVDTGGFLPGAAAGREALVRRQAELAIELSDVVIFMVDALTGATDLDGAIARALRRRAARTLLVVNKVDRPGDPVTHDFHRLGLGDPIPISAEGGLGVGDLLETMVPLLPSRDEEPLQELPRVAIVGRPN